MIAVILDTNVVVQSVIGSPTSTSARVLDAYFADRFRLVHSTATVDELLEVMCVPHIRRRHGYSDEEILELLASLLVGSETFPGDMVVSPVLTRDLTDTKFLALAADSEADYLVTNDHRHLLPLRQFQTTRIVTPAAFLRDLEG